jgi:uncharacterized protein YecE (DUF72 family)
MKPSKTRIRVGVGGWTFPPWRGTFYPDGLPQKRELEHASRQLTSIEINGTYYGTQKPESFRKWHDETPDDFVFAIKGSRYVTNRRLLSTAGESIERFVTSGIAELKDKLGPINWQFATTKTFDAADFEAFLKLLPRTVDGRALRHAVEVRHESFRTPEFVALARAHEVAVVLAADGAFPQIADLTAPFVYARIMGTRETQKSGYSSAAIKTWSERAKQLADGKIPAGLQTAGPAVKGGSKRDVFLYVISGFKERNPLAAMAIAQRL